MDNKKKVGASCTAVPKLQNDDEDGAYVFVSSLRWSPGKSDLILWLQTMS